MESDHSSKLFSILMFPWLAHGHAIPYLELAKNLSRKNFRIHFCSTPIILDSIKIATVSSIQFVELHLPSFPDLPPHYHTTKNIPTALIPRLLEVFKLSVDSFSAVLADLKPDLLIYDVFQPWAATMAASLGIPAVHFATSGAAAYSFVYHMLTCSGSAFPYPGIYFKDHELRGLKRGNIAISRVKEDDPATSSFSHFLHSCGIVLMKTSRGMEGKLIDHLSFLCKKKVVPVGPLIAESSAETGAETIMEWLGKKSQFSTVYISFGSENYLSRDQISEMAKGLEICSDVNFIWVLRSPVGESITAEEVTPDGFLVRVKERGMILTRWAPQTKILAHESVGAFVSHCGASSIIESLYFGVPVVALPLKLDQPLNARFVVEEGVGVEVEKDGDGNWKDENVAAAIKAATVGVGGEELRRKAKEMGEKMRSEEGDEMNETVEELFQICIKHRTKQHEKNTIL